MLKKFKDNKDVIYRETNANCIIVYQEHLCNILEFMKDFYPRIEEKFEADLDDLFPGICKKIDKDFKLVEQMIFSGLLVAYRNFKYYAFDLSKAPSRATGDSIAEAESAFASRDGFVENFKENIALIRTRVRDSNLRIDNLMIGRRSKTNVSLLSIDDIHNQGIRKEILKELEKIDIDAIITMDDLSSYFQGSNLFPTYQYIGSPDMACRRLYNGEFVIVIDRVSCVLVIPVTISITSRMSIDNLNIPIFSFFEKLFIIIALFMSTIFLGLVSSFTTYQSESLSLRALSILKITQHGVIFPVFYEICIVLALLELLYLIGFRQSKLTISSTVVLIAGIIIGDNLVKSGVAGVLIISLTAVSFLMSFIVSSNVTVLMSLSAIRFLVLLSSFYFGLLGVLIASIILVFYLYKQKTFGVHYFYPFVPFDVGGIRRFFMSTSSLKNRKRDESLRVSNLYRRRVK